MTVLRAIAAGLVVLVCLAPCSRKTNREILLFDFETEAELDRLLWSCHTLYSLSDRHAAHGSHSLKIELFPSDSPGLVPLLAVKDWSPYTELSFDIYNPSREPVRAEIRVDDKDDYPDYGDRYNKRVVLKSGGNHITIPLYSLVASGSNRHLHLGHIRRLFIFLPYPGQKTTLYVDAIKLARENGD